MQLITCTKCGKAFPSPVDIRNSFSTTIRNVRANCPYCGHIVPVIADGTYDFDRFGNPTLQGTINVLQQGHYNPEVLRRLLALTAQAKASPSLREEFTKEANTIAPGLGDKLEAYFKSRQYTIAALGLLLAAIVFLAPYLKADDPVRPVINNTTNTYNITVPSTQSVDAEKRKVHKAPGTPGSNLTPPRSKKAHKKRRK
jgi:DNA-directed RNA polymerase subunit RPC12/RpoP